MGLRLAAMVGKGAGRHPARRRTALIVGPQTACRPAAETLPSIGHRTPGWAYWARALSQSGRCHSSCASKSPTAGAAARGGCPHTVSNIVGSASSAASLLTQALVYR